MLFTVDDSGASPIDVEKEEGDGSNDMLCTALALQQSQYSLILKQLNVFIPGARNTRLIQQLAHLSTGKRELLDNLYCWHNTDIRYNEILIVFRVEGE